MNLLWKCVFFNELSVHELYTVIKLRNEVFVVEQNCVFQDADDKDQKCYHLLGTQGDKLVAYARLVPPGVSYIYPSIGRVVTLPASRRSGAGRQLMHTAITHAELLFGKSPIKIGAQLYLKKFYESFGFLQSGLVYDEDGIDHIEMIRE